MLIDSNDLLGHTLGTCTLQRMIGRGGMGAVYLAQQSRPRRQVAVKVLLPGLLLESELRSEFLERFRREADAIAALDHIHIVPIHEYGEQEQLAYLVMPYVTGGTLRDILARRVMLPLNETIPIIEQAADALDYAHAQGIVHRDLKPGNMLFHADGRILLADFGLAKVLKETTEADSQAASTLTSLGAMIGTPEYLSPEQATGRKVDKRTDIYSLGIILYQMLGGRVPFSGTTPVAVAIKHTMEEPPSLLQLNPTIPPDIEAVAMKAIAKKPEQRYSSAGEMARDLRTAYEALQSTSSTSSLQEKIIEHPTPISLLDNNTILDISQAPVEQVGIGQSSTVSPVAKVATYTEPGSHEVQTEVEPKPTRKTAWEKRFASSSQSNQSVRSGDGCRPLWVTLIGGMLAVILIVGGAGMYFSFLRGGAQLSTTSPRNTQTSGTGTATAQLITPLIAAGKQLYSTNRPGADCDSNGGNWTTDLNAHVICGLTATELQNSASSHLAGMFLNKLSNGIEIPDNYIFQVQVKAKTGSRGAFGVFFRTQPGTQQGTYSFLIDPGQHTWNAYIYDNTTGAASQLTATHEISGVTDDQLTIDILIQDDTFTFYLNGVKQGLTHNPTYTQGSLGLTVDVGGDVFFSNLAIYTLL